MKIGMYKWMRILLISFIGSFSIEVVIGFSSIKEFFPLTFLGYLIPLAITEDLAVRHKWNYKKIFLVGMIHGVVVDGIVLKSIFSPFWNNIFGQPDFFDVRLLGFLSFVPLGHGFITYVLSFVIADILLPRKNKTPPLKFWHYLIFIPIILLLWSLAFLGIHLQDNGYLPSWTAIMAIIAYLTAIIGIHFIFKKSGGMYIFTFIALSQVLFSIIFFNSRFADIAGWIALLSVAIFTLKKALKMTAKIALAGLAFSAWVIGGLFTTHVNANYSSLDIFGTIIFGVLILSFLIARLFPKFILSQFL